MQTPKDKMELDILTKPKTSFSPNHNKRIASTQVITSNGIVLNEIPRNIGRGRSRRSKAKKFWSENQPPLNMLPALDNSKNVYQKKSKKCSKKDSSLQQQSQQQVEVIALVEVPTPVLAPVVEEEQESPSIQITETVETFEHIACEVVEEVVIEQVIVEEIVVESLFVTETESYAKEVIEEIIQEVTEAEAAPMEQVVELSRPVKPLLDQLQAVSLTSAQRMQRVIVMVIAFLVGAKLGMKTLQFLRGDSIKKIVTQFVSRSLGL